MASQDPPVSQDDILDRALAQMALTSPNPTAPDMRTTEQKIAELNSLPLFMTDLEENTDLEAFRALAYEGTPAEVALSFKDHGNECFRAKQWFDAKEFFGQAITVLQAEVRKRSLSGRVMPGKEGDVPASMNVDEIRKEAVVLEACLANRAAAHLKLKNYRSAAMDCAAVVRINARNVKAWYRSATALVAMDRIKDADECCARGLELDPDNADLKAVADQIIKKNESLVEKARKEEVERLRAVKEAYTLRAALKAREIKTRKTAQPPEMEDAKIALMPDPCDPTSSLVFPTIFLYPLHLQSDFVKDLSELEPVGERLQYMLTEPMQWDTANEYAYKNVECYMETMTGGLIKLGKNVTLLKALSGGKVEVVDEVVRIFVVPKVKAPRWIEEFKAKKSAEKGNS